MKTCFKCLEPKPLAEFYRHSQMADGYLNKCKACARRDVGAHRAANLERIRAYDMARNTGARKARSRTCASDWCKKYPEKVRAQQMVQRAVRAGRLVRKPCEMCGAGKTVAHHDDYSKPLDVRWLCHSCHKSHHAQLRGKTPWRLISLGYAMNGTDDAPDFPTSENR